MGVPVDLCRNKEFATKAIWERKFEIDSLASFLRLAYEYQLKYNTIDFLNIRVIKAIKRIMGVVDEQTKDLRYEQENKRKFYTFYREPRELAGGEIKPSFDTGMIKTGFRPSDDPNDMAFNIPGNAMMASYLDLVAEKVLDAVPKNSVFKREAAILSRRMKTAGKAIKDAIYEFGVI
jgi:meiotically up-regulated gene 157 (Mug157) protein